MKRGLRGKRTLVKKVTSLNLYADQTAQIQAIMEATGAQKDAPLLRELVDEGLAIRRRKLVHQESAGQAPPLQDMTESLQTIQTLLLRIIGQQQTAFRIQCFLVELLQEVLVESRAGRMSLWETLAVPALREKGKSAQEVADLFDTKQDEAKDFSYGLAEEIRDELLAAENASDAITENEDQPRLFDTDTVQ